MRNTTKAVFPMQPRQRATVLAHIRGCIGVIEDIRDDGDDDTRQNDDDLIEVFKQVAAWVETGGERPAEADLETVIEHLEPRVAELRKQPYDRLVDPEPPAQEAERLHQGIKWLRRVSRMHPGNMKWK